MGNDKLTESRGDFAIQIESAQSWRRQIAQEHPDDQRNADSAEALGALLAYVDEISNDHPIFGTLALFSESNEDDGLEAIEMQNELLSRYGFDGDEDREQFLQNLASELKKKFNARPKNVV